MPVWGYHEMTRVVGKLVQNDEVLLPTVEDEIGLVVFVLWSLAKNTSLWFLSHYEFDSPGCPDALHFASIRYCNLSNG